MACTLYRILKVVMSVCGKDSKSAKLLRIMCLAALSKSV